MIPNVKTWVVKVENRNSTKDILKFDVTAPNKRLALLNFRFGQEFAGYNFNTVVSISLKKTA